MRGVPVHNQQKNLALLNGAHNVPRIFGLHIPGGIPAFDSAAFQRLDDALYQLHRRVVMIADEYRMFHRAPPALN